MNRVLFVNLTRLCKVGFPRRYLTPLHRRERDRLPHGVLGVILASRFFSAAPEGAPPLVILLGGEPTMVGGAAMREHVAEIRAAAPHARMTVVSNLLALPNWVIELSHEAFESRIETTWAAGAKTFLDGRTDAVQTRFRAKLRRAIFAGLSCPVNVDLNSETGAAGAQVIPDLAAVTGARSFEFDASVRFDVFRANPKLGAGNCRELPATIDSRRSATSRSTCAAGLTWWACSTRSPRTCSGRLRPAARIPRLIPRARGTSSPSILGTITTIPLFSDIVETYLGTILPEGGRFGVAHRYGPRRRQEPEALLFADRDDRPSRRFGCLAPDSARRH